LRRDGDLGDLGDEAVLLVALVDWVPGEVGEERHVESAVGRHPHSKRGPSEQCPKIQTLPLTARQPRHVDARKARGNVAKHGVCFWERLLVVMFTERGDAIRLVSARKATRRERRDYVESEE
jgi:hypothetical protein